jgi:hypothetical protein
METKIRNLNVVNQQKISARSALSGGINAVRAVGSKDDVQVSDLLVWSAPVLSRTAKAATSAQLIWKKWSQYIFDLT